MTDVSRDGEYVLVGPVHENPYKFTAEDARRLAREISRHADVIDAGLPEDAVIGHEFTMLEVIWPCGKRNFGARFVKADDVGEVSKPLAASAVQEMARAVARLVGVAPAVLLTQMAAHETSLAFRPKPVKPQTPQTPQTPRRVVTGQVPT